LHNLSVEPAQLQLHNMSLPPRIFLYRQYHPRQDVSQHIIFRQEGNDLERRTMILNAEHKDKPSPTCRCVMPGV